MTTQTAGLRVKVHTKEGWAYSHCVEIEPVLGVIYAYDEKRDFIHYGAVQAYIATKYGVKAVILLDDGKLIDKALAYLEATVAL